jgi:uncharacterized protein (TIGR02246 family)
MISVCFMTYPKQGRYFLKLSLLKVLILCFIISLQLSCERQESNSNFNYEQDREAIIALTKEHMTAVNTTNVELLLKGMTGDVVYLGSGRSPFIGKQELRALVEPMYEQFDINLQMTTKDILISGDLAVEWGIVTGTMTPRNGDKELEIDNKYLFVYQRQKDGTWKTAWDIYNEN